MTWGDVLSTEKIQEDSPKAEDNAFWSHPSYNIHVFHLGSITRKVVSYIPIITISTLYKHLAKKIDNIYKAVKASQLFQTLQK